VVLTKKTDWLGSSHSSWCWIWRKHSFYIVYAKNNSFHWLQTVKQMPRKYFWSRNFLSTWRLLDQQCSNYCHHHWRRHHQPRLYSTHNLTGHLAAGQLASTSDSHQHPVEPPSHAIPALGPRHVRWGSNLPVTLAGESLLPPTPKTTNWWHKWSQHQWKDQSARRYYTTCPNATSNTNITQ
jgi:hypothetical protein